MRPDARPDSGEDIKPNIKQRALPTRSPGAKSFRLKACLPIIFLLTIPAYAQSPSPASGDAASVTPLSPAAASEPTRPDSTLEPPVTPTLPPGTSAPVSNTPIGTEAATLTPPTAASVQPRRRRPAEAKLRIASWNLSAAAPGTQRPSANTQPKEQAAPTWRHTFGSERRTASWRRRSSVDLKADVIALQGLTNFRDTRRLLKARTYHLVASRQLLARSRAGSRGIPVFRSDAPPTTAIAFRRQRGIRPAGVRHFLPPVAGRSASKTAAIIALRLRVYGKMVWFASLDLSERCTAAEGETDAAGNPPHGRTDCAGNAVVIKRFTDWVATLKQQRSALVLLGRWPGEFVDKLPRGDLAISNSVPASTRCIPAPAPALSLTPETAPQLTFETASSGEESSGTACVMRSKLTVTLRAP